MCHFFTKLNETAIIRCRTDNESMLYECRNWMLYPSLSLESGTTFLKPNHIDIRFNQLQSEGDGRYISCVSVNLTRRRDGAGPPSPCSLPCPCPSSSSPQIYSQPAPPPPLCPLPLPCPIFEIIHFTLTTAVRYNISEIKLTIVSAWWILCTWNLLISGHNIDLRLFWVFKIWIKITFWFVSQFYFLY